LVQRVYFLPLTWKRKKSTVHATECGELNDHILGGRLVRMFTALFVFCKKYKEVNLNGFYVPVPIIEK
jgi:hypothetical protein